jgi:predicted patatin/cPLA2 family phospholipase
MNKQDQYAVGATESDQGFRIQVTGGEHQPQRMPTRKLALICEGGAQRGIFTAGILDSFMQQKFFPFHSLLGVSAGAQNLTSYVCDQHGYARDAIFNYTTHKEFFNPLRFARGGHLIDLDWYFGTLSQDMPLNMGHGLQRLAGRSFHICASRRQTLEADYLSFHSRNVYQSLKASCAIPLFYRQGVVVDGVDYWDGGVADSLPVQVAHSWGSDCIVVIRTQPRESVNALNVLRRNWRMRGLRKLGALIESYLKNYNAAMNFIEHPPGDVTVIDIAPVMPLKSRLLGSSMEMLRDDYHLGRMCGRQFLDNYGSRF